METIKHAIPKHNFFAIAVPVNLFPTSLQDIDNAKKGIHKTICLKDPKSDNEIHAELHGQWKFTLEELESSKAFVKLVYGIESNRLLPALKLKYPSLVSTNEVKVLLLKQLDNE